MSWKKFFKPVNSVLPAENKNNTTGSSSSVSKFNSWLPEVYSGPADRMQRYRVYEQMNLDHEISAALDTIADFGTGADEVTSLPFMVKYNDEPTDAELTVINKSLSQWVRLNELNKRMWRIFRSTLQYGDQFFLRDPESYRLYWIDPGKIEKVMVNESEGKKIETYYIKDVDLNIGSLVASNNLNKVSATQYGTNSLMFAPPLASGIGYVSGGASLGSATKGAASTIVDAEHVLQITLSDGMNVSWPFGVSVLETIYKVYKQKEMLEDAILIYRVHRAPERRVFYIDTGNIPPSKSAQYLERIKYEVQQKRIPSRTGGGCFAMNTEVPLLDGRTLSLSQLTEEYNNGKENWAYSCNPETGEMAPGLITWAGVTQKSTKVIKLTLDNGEIIVCTPEHKFPIIGRGKTAAKDIVVGEDSLYSFNPFLNEVKVKLIETIDTSMEVGTLTIDGNELHHDYHTFAIKQGVYTFNSNVTDATYNPLSTLEDYYFAVTADGRGSKVEVLPGGDNLGCFAMDTKIKLLDGRDLSIADISEELASGKPLWTYSCHPITGHVAPGKIDWAGVTKKSAQVVKVTLDNGETITCTPDHKFPINGIGFVEIKDLKPGQSLMGHYTKHEYISDSLCEEQRAARAQTSSNNFLLGSKKFQLLLDTDKAFRDYFSETVKLSQKTSKRENPDVWANRSAAITAANLERWKLDGYYNTVFDSQQLTFTAEMYQILTQTYTKGDFVSNVVDKLNANVQFCEMFVELNKGAHSNSSLNKITPRHVYLLLQSVGTDWDKFKAINAEINIDSKLSAVIDLAKCTVSQEDLISQLHTINHIVGLKTVSRHNFMKFLKSYNIDSYSVLRGLREHVNHRIVSIEYLPDLIDVGTLTIDIDEKYHDYHTYALSAGVFVKNSIDDLKYFNNKMMRALGVPSSYLPTGPDDGTSSVSDGRVGTAFIQEFRFSKVVSRYQQSVIKPLDTEFKLFLKHRGVTIDSSLFQLTMTEPQSFSEYRQLELDAAKINLYTALAEVPFISKRYALKRYLGWSESELAENENMWREEKSRLSRKFSDPGATASAPSQLSDIGITTSGIDSLPADGGDENQDFGDEDFSDTSLDNQTDTDLNSGENNI